MKRWAIAVAAALGVFGLVATALVQHEVVEERKVAARSAVPQESPTVSRSVELTWPATTWWEQSVCFVEREGLSHPPADLWKFGTAVMRCVQADRLWQIAMREGVER